MNRNCKISEEVVTATLYFLAREKEAGKSAMPEDLDFINEGAWLKDAAVIDSVSKRNGAWEVYLVFAHYKDPLKFIVRHITKCHSERKALAAAFYIKKGAAKDRRGTLTVSLNDLNLCRN
jgi:hypothetical protein